MLVGREYFGSIEAGRHYRERREVTRPFSVELKTQIERFRAMVFEVDPHEIDEIEFYLEQLAVGSWYPVGLPPQQASLEEPFARTEDIFHLVREVLRLAKGEKPTYLVVANPPHNIVSHLKSEQMEKGAPVGKEKLFEESMERARLIGLKDRALYQAAQKMVIQEAATQGEELFEIPVLLMSDLAKNPQFVRTFDAVVRLFDSNPEFTEAVYRCVPPALRHRKHRDKPYAELGKLPGAAALKEARERIPYVLYQISIVLSLGGEKLGHAGEQPYNEATLMAAQVLEQKQTPSFKELPLPHASGTIPYRAVRAEKAQAVPDALTGLVDATVLAEIDPAVLETFTREIDRLDTDQLVLQTDSLDFLDLDEEDSTRAELLTELQARHEEMTRRHLQVYSDFMTAVDSGREEKVGSMSQRVWRHSVLTNKICECVREDPSLREEDKRKIIEVTMDHEVRETLLQYTKEPFHLERFLFKWTGMTDALSRKTNEGTVAERAPEWIPFDCPTPRACTQDEDHKYLFQIGQDLLRDANDGSPTFNLSAMFPYSMRKVAEWKVPFERFARAVFNFEMEDYRWKDTKVLLAKYLNSLTYYSSKVRWETLDHFFELIQGTPYETLYRQWMAELETGPQARAEAPFDRSTLPPELGPQVSEVLASPVFDAAFREYFCPPTEAVGSSC